MFTKYFEYIIHIFILLLFYALYGHIFIQQIIRLMKTNIDLISVSSKQILPWPSSALLLLFLFITKITHNQSNTFILSQFYPILTLYHFYENGYVSKIIARSLQSQSMNLFSCTACFFFPCYDAYSL